MKTPEQIFDEIDNDPKFVGSHKRIIAIECMKRFGLHCWIDQAIIYADQNGSMLDRKIRIATEKEKFKKYLQESYHRQNDDNT